MSLERPTLGIKDYKSFSLTIADATVDQEVDFGYNCVDVVIVNDTASTITFKYNDSSNDSVSLKDSEVWSMNNFIVNKLFISNASGVAVDIRIFAVGAKVL